MIDLRTANHYPPATLDHWISLLIRGRWIFATFLITAMAGSLWLMPQLNFSFNLGRMLRGADDRVADVRNFHSTFPPSDGHIMMTASADRVVTVNDLRATERWAEQLRALPEVKAVISPKLLLDLKLDGFTLDEWARLGGTGDDPLALGDGPGMETFKGNLVSRGLKSVALYLVKGKGISGGALHRTVEKTMPPPWPEAKMRSVGTDYLLQQMGDLLSSNFRPLVLFEILALLLIIPFFMRSFRRAYLPVLISWAALTFYLAIFILAGQKFGPMQLAGPRLILIIGLADATHLQQKFDGAR